MKQKFHSKKTYKGKINKTELLLKENAKYWMKKKVYFKSMIIWIDRSYKTVVVAYLKVSKYLLGSKIY